MNFLSNRDKLYSKILKLFFILILFCSLVVISTQKIGARIKCETDYDCPKLGGNEMIVTCMDTFCIFRYLRKLSVNY
uniref:Nodule-specific cysteine-rich peptide G24 n=1 Tax=Pisum sativum TaxID=3888 RepID=A0A7T8IFX4_PEA|nr:nodule-specific cysteine-rich peptide G24 [Pisum sativum]